MNRGIIIAFLFLFSLTGLVKAQSDDWEDDSKIDDKEIVIEKDKKIELPIANKNYEKIPQLPPSHKYTVKPYKLSNYSMVYSPVNPGIRVLKIKDEKLNKLYGNYIKAGYGNFGTPLLEAFVSNKRNEDYLVGARFNHFSSSKGPVDDENSASGMTEAGIFAKAFTDKATIGGKLEFSNRFNYFYGYNPALEVSRDSIKQKFNTFGISLGVEGNDEKSPVQYALDASFYSIGDNYDASETSFGLKFNGDYKLSESSSIGLESSLDLSTYKDPDSQKRNIFRIYPSYTFNYENLLIKAGLNVAFENDTLSGKDDLHIYPMAEVTWPVEGDFKVSAGIRGDIDRVNYRDLTEVNPWLNQQVPLLHTNRKIDFYGRIKGKISNSFDFSAGVSLAQLENFHVFINDPSDSARFLPLYDLGTTSRTTLDGEVSYEYRDLFFLNAKIEVFNYDTDEIGDAWHLPNLSFNLSGGYNIYDKILLEAELITLTGLNALDPVDQTSVKLDGIADMNFKAEYLISERASVFLNFYNVFSSEYERYLNYPSRGFMFVGGISYSF